MRILLLLLTLFVCAQAKVIFVNEQNRVKDANGSSWKDAYYSLERALNLASKGDEVWVAKGEYIVKPKRLEKISVYGGFSATESSLSERDLTKNETKVYGRLVLQNSFLSSVTILEEPENKRAIELNFQKRKHKTLFQPDKKLIHEQRRERARLHANEMRMQTERPFKPKPVREPLKHERDVIKRFDQNLDGVISRYEAPAKMRRDWHRLDRNRDGFVDLKELHLAHPIPPHPREE